LSKPQIFVGAKHSGRQIIAEKIRLMPECFALPWFINLKTAVGLGVSSSLTDLDSTALRLLAVNVDFLVISIAMLAPLLDRKRSRLLLLIPNPVVKTHL